MRKLLIEGGHKLTGKISISGFKNAAVAIIPASILAGDKCVIENLPNIRDVHVLGEILEELGATVAFDGEKKVMEVDTELVLSCHATYEMAKKLRASYYLLGAALGRFKKAQVAFPGGCDIGTRPIDQHIKGFEALGAKVVIEHGIIHAEAEELVGAEIYLDVVSVGATINIMLAACMAKGTTIIDNAAKEPHVVDVANFLNSMGADIRGAGTDVIKIHGVEKMHGCTYSVIPDQIEAGTFMIMAAATGGDVIIDNIIPKHLDPITAKLREMGMEIEENGESLRVVSNSKLKACNIKTLVYPGFPTDLQQPMSALLTVANGTSIVAETIYEGRFKHVDELKRMGAKIKVEGRVAVIEGTSRLSGATVSATDLRAGAALVVAGLMAEGVTEVENVQYIDRGYDSIENKLLSLGAKIKRV
ncbi:UDP-N-acetylglucosamine 1-carboxyvinyltransferase [Geosporobacter ferrireducens]|uniref:UDP-N-acetylglucosamine 1-carboxyvinyltransferase n=1 Tax=Geosporobacter ferrireducens TaxID=1424294 RepID=A0A1D8GI22_9FIRM|nr:UDP-N-acetylglucosamine 1-carboxyvinyltransferase [Geosporobacter ferrireducens]AOT70549.1 UDP-N-acetylglucosamine 1-carboxyvinyltransferase [Geosporobacter ferrireducens]MTI57091.1 UDP-N-acetylglucosamine 1-carboxyvinyltransferase [Geosporobacter ferrireducens]